MSAQEGNALKTARNTDGLREALFQELDSLRDNKISPRRARAAASISREILSSARIEIEAKRLQLEYELGSAMDAKPVLGLTGA